jgi:hypothetical protein
MSKWTYQVRQINNSVSLLVDNRKIGTLYGSGRASVDQARLITHAPEMLSMLVECSEVFEDLAELQSEEYSELVGNLLERIEEMLVRIGNEEVKA